MEAHFSSPMQSIMLQRMKVEHWTQTMCQVWGKSKSQQKHMGEFRKTSYCRSQAITSAPWEHMLSEWCMDEASMDELENPLAQRALMRYWCVCACAEGHAGNVMATGSVWKRLDSPDRAHTFVFSTAPILNWSGITLEAGPVSQSELGKSLPNALRQAKWISRAKGKKATLLLQRVMEDWLQYLCSTRHFI